MSANIEDETLLSTVELLCFVADLCACEPEPLKEALCSFTTGHYLAEELGAEVRELADELARALGFADASLEPAT
jgi:hypothetical protein